MRGEGAKRTGLSLIPKTKLEPLKAENRTAEVHRGSVVRHGRPCLGCGAGAAIRGLYNGAGIDDEPNQ